ncbi:MAG: DUF1566 domain-containing protein [Candidatus Aureabacteria bacterium]|nr:DUF1566 domain-containing protein [Candidatus Auribacterota bacterium]
MYLILVTGLAGLAFAGSIDSPGAPSTGSGMYSLSQIYDYLNSGIEVTPAPSFQEPGAAPGSTMKTTKEIYDDIKAVFSQCDATAENVELGKKFFCTHAGSWGMQTGKIVSAGTPTPTQTPTPMPTATPTKTWYEQYGPAGEDKVVLIGSLNLYVAKWTNNAGTASNSTKDWQTACSWGTDLDWCGKSTGWRLPHQDELIAIYPYKTSLGSWENDYYWSSDEFDSSSARDVSFYNGNATHDLKTRLGLVRVVRPVE